MRKDRIKTIVLVALLLSTNAFWIYNTLDNGVSLTYMEESHDSAMNMYRQVEVLANLNLLGLEADEAKAVVGKDVDGSDLFEKEGCLYAGQVCIALNENRIVVGIGER